MSKHRVNPKESQDIYRTETIPEIPETEYKYLPKTTLNLWNTWKEKNGPRDTVPSPTPNSEYNFQRELPVFPDTFPSLDNLELPFVREKGVKFYIDALAEFFNCKHYKFNLLQFWFLDVITDCIWRAQDDFNLPVIEQKIVLNWVLYLFNLIRDPDKNMSRKQFFCLFKEAMLLAAEVIDESNEAVPVPEKLFIMLNEDDEVISWSSISNSSLEINGTDFDNVTCVELNIENEKFRYVLPQEFLSSSTYDTSSVDSTQESNTTPGSKDKLSKDEFMLDDISSIKFYQPSVNTPERFQSTPSILEKTGSVKQIERKFGKGMSRSKLRRISSVQKESISQVDVQAPYQVYEMLDQFSVGETLSVSETADSTLKSVSNELRTLQVINNSSVTSTYSTFEGLSKDQILKELAVYKMWEQHLKDMQDPKKGWIPTRDELESSNEAKLNLEVQEEDEEEISEDEEDTDDEEWANLILQIHQEKIEDNENKLVINFGVLRAIIDFVFKHFYESFQYSIIKLAFQAAPDTIFQKLNTSWIIPKKTKSQLKKPKPPKQPKKKKEKSKKPKKTKAKKKGAKKGGKGKAKSKDKKKKPEKKKKPPRLTKEEKKRLAQQKKEEALRIEELRKIEEHKRYLYPLTEAATDDFFKEIFNNWTKVATKNKDKKKGKGKKK